MFLVPWCQVVLFQMLSSCVIDVPANKTFQKSKCCQEFLKALSGKTRHVGISTVGVLYPSLT